MGEQKRGGVILFGGGVAISVPFSPIKPIQISWNIQQPIADIDYYTL